VSNLTIQTFPRAKHHPNEPSITVFETMFYGDMADKSKYIRIPDVAPIGFENLLRYAYTDSLNLNTVEDAMLTAYAAKKYLLPQLLRECLTYIEHNIGPSTACVVFEFAQVLNSQQLALQAMNLIDRQTNSVLSNKSFTHVQASTVEFVANRKYLSLDTEYSLFNAIIGWSTSEAKRRNLPADDWYAIRAILSENSILGAIRFLAMDQEEFAKVVLRTSALVEAAPVSGDSSTNGQAGETGIGGSKQRGKIDVGDSNTLLTDTEQRSIFLNLALNNVARLPPTINPSSDVRQPPPEYFTLKRFGAASSSGGIVTTTTTTRSIKSITSKFQCLSENVFIVALTLPLRLDVASSYTNRTPKFECHLKFTTRIAASGSGERNSPPNTQDNPSNLTGAQSETIMDGSTLLMDTIDESLHISIARDKDCLVRLERPILIRAGNINELTLTFQTYALDEDVVALRVPKSRSGNFSEQTDGENISWLFFKTQNIEFSELHYYY